MANVPPSKPLLADEKPLRSRARKLRGPSQPNLPLILCGSRRAVPGSVKAASTSRPAARSHNHRTVSNRLGKVAEEIERWDVASPYRLSRAGKSPVSVFIDGAYIRAVPGYQSRHFEVAMGRVVVQGRAPRQFAGAPHIATGKHYILRAALRAQGWLSGRNVTVFSDGEVGLQNIALSATRQPSTHILDWFHLSMRCATSSRPGRALGISKI